jgi:hypothetical protein
MSAGPAETTFDYFQTIAEAITKLINSKPRSPTIEEIKAVLRDAVAPVPEKETRICEHANSRYSGRVPSGSDIQRHYRQRVVSSPGSSVTAQDLYDDYCYWCEAEGKEPLPMPTYSREFKSLGIRKDKIGGRIRYFDVELRSALERAEDAVQRAATAQAG